LEGLARIEAPTLSILDIQFFNQLTFTVPRLLQFMRASKSLRFSAVKIAFDGDFLDLIAGPDPGWQKCSLHLQIICKHLDWQVASAVQIFESISPVFSGVEELMFFHVARNRSADPHDKVDRTQWRKLLRLFNNVKSFGVPETLSGRFSHSLCSADGEMSMELLPNLLVLQHLGGSSVDDVFTSFIHDRRAATAAGGGGQRAEAATSISATAASADATTAAASASPGPAAPGARTTAGTSAEAVSAAAATTAGEASILQLYSR
jgi:hypothetical protein